MDRKTRTFFDSIMPETYNLAQAKALGSVSAAILLRVLRDIAEINHTDWITLDQTHIYDLTALDRVEQNKTLKLLSDQGIVEVRYQDKIGYVRFNRDGLKAVIEAYLKEQEDEQID